MSRDTHTPGPWVAEENTFHLPRVDAPGAEQTITDRVYGGMGNARLIAASPAMLDRLEQCLHVLKKWHDTATGEREFIALVEKTIAEVKGG